jgi:hypothetical protein
VTRGDVRELSLREVPLVLIGGSEVIDQAALPGPYITLGAPSARLPVEAIYSRRNGRLKPFKRKLPILDVASKL